MDIEYDIFNPLSCLIIDWDDGVVETFGFFDICKLRYPDLPHVGPIENPGQYGHVYQWVVTQKSFRIANIIPNELFGSLIELSLVCCKCTFCDPLNNLRKEGMYLVDAFAFDDSTTLNEELNVVVADIPCDMPSVVISGAQTNVKKALEFIRSIRITFEAYTVVKCNISVSVL